MKTYKTSSGTYTEAELAVVVWRNPKNKKSSQARFFETMTAEESLFPMAFPIAFLAANKEWAQATRISSMTDIMNHASTSSRTRPMIVPLPVAESVLGWSTFYVPTEYTE